MPLRGDLPAEEHVLHRVQVGARARSWYTTSMPSADASCGAVMCDPLALEVQLSLVERQVSGQRLDQRGLAGPVVADDRDDLAGVDVEVRSVERPDVAEASGQASRFEKWCHAMYHLFDVGGRDADADGARADAGVL